MTDENTADSNTSTGTNTAEEENQSELTAVRYADGSLGYPAHTLGSDGNPPVDTIDLREYTAEIITWTKATATPPGVREPNTLAIVEFEIDDESVRAIGQVTTTCPWKPCFLRHHYSHSYAEHQHRLSQHPRSAAVRLYYSNLDSVGAPV